MEEKRFQRELAALITRYDDEASPGTKQSADAWHAEFEGLLMEASEGQATRALDLLALHVQNRYAPEAGDAEV